MTHRSGRRLILAVLSIAAIGACSFVLDVEGPPPPPDDAADAAPDAAPDAAE